MPDRPIWPVHRANNEPSSMVRKVGLEPTSPLRALASKTSVYTVPPLALILQWFPAVRILTTAVCKCLVVAVWSQQLFVTLCNEYLVGQTGIEPVTNRLFCCQKWSYQIVLFGSLWFHSSLPLSTFSGNAIILLYPDLSHTPKLQHTGLMQAIKLLCYSTRNLQASSSFALLLLQKTFS